MYLFYIFIICGKIVNGLQQTDSMKIILVVIHQMYEFEMINYIASIFKTHSGAFTNNAMCNNITGRKRKGSFFLLTILYFRNIKSKSKYHYGCQHVNKMHN